MCAKCGKSRRITATRDVGTLNLTIHIRRARQTAACFCRERSFPATNDEIFSQLFFLFKKKYCQAKSHLLSKQFSLSNVTFNYISREKLVEEEKSFNLLGNYRCTLEIELRAAGEHLKGL
jgi:hypothetical protein